VLKKDNSFSSRNFRIKFSTIMAGYFYGNSLYFPDPWQTTWLPKHFPEHHYPLEHTRHAIGHTFSDIAHEFANLGPSGPVMICPRVDAHESQTTFYIDVELPGLRSEEQITLKWISTRTLLLRAVVRRTTTPEDEIEVKRNVGQTSATPTTEVTQNKMKDGKARSKSNEEIQPIYMTLGERRIGAYGRAFNFPVDVNHESTTAKLDAGVLRITVPKVETASRVDKKVTVETGTGQVTGHTGL
jgi:HSP20 family molecular chaperone IbpA